MSQRSGGRDAQALPLALALEAARNLPADAQNDIARVVLRLADADDEPPVPLTPDPSLTEKTRGLLSDRLHPLM
jgi:hypothetical protein